MEGCLGTTIKYLLFATNFIVFVLGCAVLGVGIWVIVDAETFMDLFGQIKDILDTDVSISIYSSATYILIAVAVIVILITFFGCCGAVKESKCLLGTYFAIVLAVFIMCIVGAVLGYSGDLESTLKEPFELAMKKYSDTPTTDVEKSFKTAINQAQQDFKCCGVSGVEDWRTNPSTKPTAPAWDPSGTDKPRGCCVFKKDGTEMNDADILKCRKDVIETHLSTKYNFNGCYEEFESKIKENQNLAVGIAIGIVVVMFLNMLFAFAMCTMSGK